VVIFEAIALYVIVAAGIHPSLCASVKEIIAFELRQQPGVVLII
jgi:hypothetical protein